MKPYYEHAGITIYHGDCREILPQLVPVDLVLTDPPFGVGIEYESFEDSQANVKALIDSSLPLIFASAKVVLIATGIKSMWLYPQPDWILHHFNPGGERSSPWGFTCTMPVLVYGKCPYLSRGLGSRPDSFWARPRTIQTLGHPCAKHEDVWMWFLHRGSALHSDIILDPFMGSGTTLRVAKDTGRKAIGIDIEEKYCEIAAERMQQEVIQFGEDARAGQGECPGTACNSASMQVALDI
jgi:site-specific DNA-methyltransferase (adenine-specific)